MISLGRHLPAARVSSWVKSISAWVRAAGAAGDLDQQLRELFARAKVGAEQAFVDADHGNQGQVGQVVALGQHLGADQHARRGAELRQQIFQRVAFLRAAAVDAQHRELVEARGQRFLDAFGAGALRLQGQAAAIGAGVGRGPAGAAVVALQAPAAAVHGHRRGLERGAAARAVRGPAAVVAQQHWGVAAPVLEHQRLAAGAQFAVQAFEQLRRQAGL